MRKILMTSTALLFAVFIYAQGKNGVTQTAQAESTPVVAVSTAVADSGAATVESKTVKTEIQSPGVVTEYKEDGTKVVTINLSEVDENKLPEKYEAKVILEAPIVIATKENNWITPIGTFQAGEAGRECEYDVSIDEKGNIFILDPCNGRITVYNNKGKLTKTIPVAHAYTNNIDGSVQSYKKQITTAGGEIYLRDVIGNKIERTEESGKVVETIDIPKEINGKSTRGMKMEADEEGLVLDGKNLESKNIKDINKENRKKRKSIKKINIKMFENVNQKFFVVQNSPMVSEVQFKYEDGGNNTYFYSMGRKGLDKGFVKVSPNGTLLALIRDWKYRVEDIWKDDCGNRPKPLLKNWEESMIFDREGNIFFIETICCKGLIDCVEKIRIVKLSKGDN